MFAALNKKLQIFIKKLPEIFTNIFAMGGTKLMDELGNKLNLAVPDNEAAIKQVIKENVKLVKDITNSQRGGMVEVLKKGVKDGKTYAQVAKDMHETVKDISVERGKLIASTEMNKAMSASMENTLVHNKIEFYLYVTARDNRVSEICNMNSYGQKTQGKTMIKHTVGKGPLPVRNSHPRCRCIIVKAPD